MLSNFSNVFVYNSCRGWRSCSEFGRPDSDKRACYFVAEVCSTAKFQWLLLQSEQCRTTWHISMAMHQDRQQVQSKVHDSWQQCRFHVRRTSGLRCTLARTGHSHHQQAREETKILCLLSWVSLIITVEILLIHFLYLSIYYFYIFNFCIILSLYYVLFNRKIFFNLLTCQ